MRKRKNTGRLLSILLCLVMVLGMLPTTALADEPQLEGDPIPESISFSVMKTDDNGSPLKGAHFELTPMQGTNSEGKFGNVKKCAVGKYPKSEKLGSAGQAACCACAHSRYLTGGSPSGLRV